MLLKNAGLCLYYLRLSFQLVAGTLRTLETPKGRFDPSPNPSLYHKYTSSLLSPAAELSNTPRIDTLAPPPGSWTSPHLASPATTELLTVTNGKPVPTPSTAASRSPTTSQFSRVAPNPTGTAKTTYNQPYELRLSTLTTTKLATPPKNWASKSP